MMRCERFHREIVEKRSSPHTYLLLGDAYMNILEVRGISLIISF